ncbi:hypothetical protein ACN5ZH_000305 [Pseudomonas aeruginosa]|uniref:hypothetical protein n=1 Tax=Pseudomonas aeruginosa TaxID=287 RepID=UPI000EB728F9|nr:hypothetical protein [Pseudomonas aeruginosa]AXS88629.1 hypothetical protein D0Y56_17205 [Pseudomonas aeruginosa]RUJ02810.1 hypothetical protein IPC392_07530 [Pseudomonas aeruginosa]HCF5293778.1 hypothetical protein [Pseudomonas aeruginosa]
MIEPQSPYLSHQHRLADLVAAIQVMGTYSYSARTIDSWAEILGQKPRSGSSWASIFNEHPEFFRVGLEEDGLHTLALRRAQPRVYNTQTGEEITVAQFKAIPQGERSHFSRRPLSSEQMLSLIDVAVKLHTQAAVRRQELRWWVSVVVSVLAGLVGAMIGATWGS